MEFQEFAKRLAALPKDELIHLLYTLSGMSEENKACIEACCIDAPRENPELLLAAQQIAALWQNARQLIEDADAYGSISYSSEEKVMDALFTIEKTAGSLDLPWNCRKPLIMEMMEVRALETTGFEDQLFDAAHTLCQNNLELAFLASQFSTDVRAEAHRAAALYEEAGMKETAMELRLHTMESESDYLQAAHQYEASHMWEKAEEVLLQGLKECRSHSKERMTRYLAELYLRHHQQEALLHLEELVAKDNNPLELHGLDTVLYEDARQHGSYARQKELLFALMASARALDLQDWYEEGRSTLYPSDFDEFLSIAYQAGLDRNILFYLDLCMENGRKEEVLRYLQEHVRQSNWDSHWGFWVDKDYKYSTQLEEEYPDEIYAYYKIQAEAYLAWKGDHNVHEAAKLLERMKQIRHSQNRLQEWEEYIESLNWQYNSRKRLVAMLSSL